MIVERTTFPRPRVATLRDRLADVPAGAWLAVIVSLGAALRVAAALAHSTPRLFPDEYIYSSLARSLAHGSTAIRGEPAHFPALLEPLLTAPLSLFGSTVVQYRLTQVLHGIVVALVAVPVYLIARRVGLSAGKALASSSLALVLPALAYAGFVTADAVALTLALAALAAATFALDRPAGSKQALFLTLAGLATFARVQYVVLFAAFVVATLVVSRGSVVRAVRDFTLTAAALGACTAAVLAAGPARALGYYDSVLGLDVAPGALARWATTDLMLLAYAAGIVLVPAALVGLVAALWRPRSRAEHGFAALVAATSVFLLFEATLYAANGSERFQERYLIALLPTIPVLFFMGARRLHQRSARVATALLAAGLFLVAATVPLSTYTQLSGKQDSPTLWAVYQLEQLVDVGPSSLIISGIAACLAAVAAIGAWRPRLGVPACVAAASVALAAAAVGATAYDIETSDRVQATYLGPNPTWIDEARLGAVAILQTPYSSRQQISEQMLWNRSLTQILQMRDATPVDDFGATRTRIGARGAILAADTPVEQPLLVQEYASWLILDEATLVERRLGTALWRADGAPRVALMLTGRYFDGWLATRNDLTVWPRPDGPREGTLTLTFSLPAQAPPQRIHLRAPGVERSVAIAPGARTVVRLPVSARTPWRLHLNPDRPLVVDGNRLVAARLAPPIFVESSKKS